MIKQLFGNTIITKIHDKYYDLSNFEHPGGPVALYAANGRDATCLFESHHIMSDKLIMDDILNRYKIDNYNDSSFIENISMPYNWNVETNFHEELKELAINYFGKNNRFGVMKANFTKWMEIFTLFFINFFIVYYYLIGCWWALFLLPFTIWISGVNYFHDGSHFALSTKWWINYISMYINPWFSSPIIWIHQHIIGHHNYVNIPEKDPDLYHSVGGNIGDIRLTKKTEWKSGYLYQHTIGLILNWTFAIPWGLSLAEPFHTLKTGKYLNTITFNKLTPLHKFIFIFFRIITVFIVYILPFLLFNPIKALISATYPIIVLSWIFMFFTQINHLTLQNSDINNPNFFIHQIITSHNIMPYSYLAYIVSGGLNLQIEHHLFPSINHCHLRNLQPSVQKLCHKYNIPYHISHSFTEAFFKYLDLLVKYSKKS